MDFGGIHFMFWLTLEAIHRPAAGGAVGSNDWLGEFVFCTE